MSLFRFARRANEPEGPFAALRIALITDDLTFTALAHECDVRAVTPRNFRRVARHWKPDLLLVESAWNGHGNAWRYKIASYPDHPRRTNHALAKVVRHFRDANIPAVFWNREDGVHFDRFIDSARLFDRVLTVDETMLPRYRERLQSGARVDTMMFAASPSLHFPTWQEPHSRAAFVGSYSNVHGRRRDWQDAMFRAARPLGLTVYDRNSGRKADHYRFPAGEWIDVRPAVPHHQTPAIYRQFLVNLNVNTMVDSPSAFSRRLVELLGCGAFVLTNDTLAVRTHFQDLCIASDDPAQAEALFQQLARDGLTADQRDMRERAVERVHRDHSWAARIPILLEMARC